MSETSALITGKAAAIRIENLDTDQIMPKQFLRGIDKAGLDQGVLYDQRFDTSGAPRPEFVLNRVEYAGTQVLIGGANFGCGSSREHAVWGLQQFGIRAVVAASFGEIFYSNAMNNRLMLVALPRAAVEELMAYAESGGANRVTVDVAALRVRTPGKEYAFELSPRHRRMFLEGLDMIGLSLTQRAEIERFAQGHWGSFPWMHDVAKRTRERLETR